MMTCLTHTASGLVVHLFSCDVLLCLYTGSRGVWMKANIVLGPDTKSMVNQLLEYEENANI